MAFSTGEEPEELEELQAKEENMNRSSAEMVKIKAVWKMASTVVHFGWSVASLY